MYPTRIAPLLTLVLLTSSFGTGCASLVSATRPAAKAAGGLALSSSEEKQMGQQMSAEVKKTEKVLADSTVQSYVSSVANTVLSKVPAAKRKFTYQFTVLDSPEVNAFALPGGYIFVYAGLLKAASSEAELASVLSHEIAHVTEGHISQALAAQVGIELLQSLALGKEPGMLKQLASNVASQGYMAAYSRGSESNADETGLGYLVAAGYDPRAMPAFFEKLKRLAGGSPGLLDSFFASHPDSGERAKTITKLIAQKNLTGGKSEIVGSYGAMKASLK